MASVKTFSFDAFPNDDKIYRLYWAGQVQVVNSEDVSSKVFAWLKEVDAEGCYVSNAQARLVTQSAGAIPSLYIGSLWQSQSLLVGSRIPSSPSVELEIEAQSAWQSFRAGDTKERGERKQDWINPSDYPLKISSIGARNVAAYHAWVVPMRTTDGREVVIPCYEIYRAFYAGSSELAWRLLTAPWTKISHHFVNAYELTETDDGHGELVVDPVLGIGRGVMPFLGALILSEAAKQSVNRVYADLINEALMDGEHKAWIRAVPPFLNQRFRIRAHVQALDSRDGLLVLKIDRATFPIDIARISYLEDVHLPEQQKDEEKDEQRSNSPETLDAEENPVHVGRSGTRRPSSRRMRLSLGKEFWLEGPELKKAIRKTRRMPSQEEKGEEAHSQIPLAVGLGGPGDYKSAKPGSIEYHDKVENVERMAAMQALFARLTGQVIDTCDEWALVGQIVVEGRTFCALPHDTKDDVIKAWALGFGGDDDTPRLVWVVRLCISGQIVYWIEVEHVKNDEHYCSLAFKMLGSAELDANVLSQLLSVCVSSRGIWPKHAPDSLAQKLHWVKARHHADDQGGLRSITLTNRLDDLGVVWRKAQSQLTSGSHRI